MIPYSKACFWLGPDGRPVRSVLVPSTTPTSPTPGVPVLIVSFGGNGEIEQCDVYTEDGGFALTCAADGVPLAVGLEAPGALSVVEFVDPRPC